jgi:hypothetical protein
MKVPTWSGNHGIIANATWTTAGRYGKALVSNGTSSWVTIADAPSLDLTTGMTLEAWIYPTTSGTNMTYLRPWRDYANGAQPVPRKTQHDDWLETDERRLH